jgi:glutathione S-transferase
MAGINFEYVGMMEHMGQGGPSGKMPWVHWRQLNNGLPMGDSYFIIDELLRTQHIDLDSWLTAEQKAVSAAFRAMLEESVYFGCSHIRWATPEFWRATCDTYFRRACGLPPPLHWIVGLLVRWQMRRSQWAQGTGRLSDAEVTRKVGAELRAAEAFLGGKQYLMGDRPSSIDATAYAYIAAFLQARPPPRPLRARPSAAAACEIARGWPAARGGERGRMPKKPFPSG